jgi:hypothetical protein
MATCTPVYGFTYAVGSDAPCDIDDTLCAFAAEVEAELDRIDTVVDRTVDSVPMAQVRMTLTTAYPSNPGGGTPAVVAFDTVDVDTEDMVNLTDDPYTITLPRFGRYLVYANAVGVTVGAGNTVTLNAASTASDQYLDDASTPIYLNAAAELRYAASGVLDVTSPALTCTVSCAAASPVFTSITFGAYWLGDLP